jgi:hypothetical protein
VEEFLGSGTSFRDRNRAESIAVGSEGFVAGVKDVLGAWAKGRRVHEAAGDRRLKEFGFPYDDLLEGENGPLSLKNRYFSNVCQVESGR